MRHFSCSHVGISGSTHIYTEKRQTQEYGEEIWKARVGIAIMGYTNNENRVDNPFDRRYSR